MNFSAIIHTAADNFCYPLNEDTLVIAIKTGYDVPRVFALYGDPFDGTATTDGWKWTGKRVELTERKELAHHIWHSVTVPLAFGRCKYYFELHSSNSPSAEIRYYFEDGFYTEEEMNRMSGYISCFTFPWMNEAECLSIPGWVSRTVWYQIFPDRFCKAPAGLPAVGSLEDCSSAAGYTPWASADSPVSNTEKYGGTIQGIISRLDYLQDLGINGLYLNPLNASPSVHKYDTTDYGSIDPAFGTADDVRRLVREAHKRGIKVIFDGVFNHCGWNFAPWQDVVQKGSKSPYWKWFTVKSWPIETTEEKKADGTIEIRPSGTNGKNSVFKTFAYIDCMPKLNTNNPEVIEYLLTECGKWVETYDIDGLRLDVANELSHTFCSELRKRMRSIKSDFYILGEIWHNAMPWLRGNEFDSVMNYPLARAFWKFFQDSAQTARSFEHDLNAVFTMYPVSVNAGLFNLLDSHDTMRIFTRSKSAEAVFQQYALLFTLQGSPCIYYGGEILLAGGEDPDNRRCMPWAHIENGTHSAAHTLIKQLISLRHTHPAMTAGGYQFIHHSDAAARIVHLRKYSLQTSGTQESSSIHLIMNCSAEAIPVLQFTGNGAKIHLSYRCTEEYIQAGGFLFFE